jgi:hypothetical protein
VSAVPADDFTLRMARDLGRQGFRVVRVYEGDKRPVGLDWPTLATADVDVLTEQFTPGGLGLGIACGPQPNGRDLVVVDVDVKHDGMANWERIVAEHGPFAVTATHTTPSGGMHLFWDSPETFPNGKLAPGVDIRGNGGQVVVPPSWRLIDGEQVHYRERWKMSGVWRHPMSALPIPIWEMLQRPSHVEIAASVARHPSQEPLSNADWLRDHWDWVATLEAQGHTAVKQIGRDVYMRHPTATAEHSAVIHLDANMMNAWSTNMPEPLRDAQVNRDGSIAWSPYDWFVATQHDRDHAAAMLEISHRRGLVTVGVTPERAEPASPLVEATATHRLPVAPAEYWLDERNAHILQAARARRVGPDALDINVLCLQSLLIPPRYVLPPLIGGTAPLNMLGCILARTGETKTTATRVAKDLLGPMPSWVLMLSIGSGEGIGATYLMEETEENGKGQRVKTGRLVRNPNIWAGFFETDEGLNLVQQAKRAGTTVIPTLCKGWSGSQLGEANADPSKRRLVAEMSYRLAAVVNIQPSNFNELFSVANTGTGLTGRFLFAPASDYEVPDQRPDWPGPLSFPFLQNNTPLEIGVPGEIVAEIDAAIVSVHRNASLAGEGDATSHRNQVALRIAAIRAVARGETDITLDDWRLAKLRTDTSAACQNALASYQAVTLRDRRHKEDEAKALSTVHQATIAEQADIAKFKGRIIERCGHAGMTRRQVKDLKDTPRDVLWAALNELLAEGLLVQDGSLYRRAR